MNKVKILKLTNEVRMELVEDLPKGVRFEQLTSQYHRKIYIAAVLSQMLDDSLINVPYEYQIKSLESLVQKVKSMRDHGLRGD